MESDGELGTTLEVTRGEVGMLSEKPWTSSEELAGDGALDSFVVASSNDSGLLSEVAWSEGACKGTSSILHWDNEERIRA